MKSVYALAILVTATASLAQNREEPLVPDLTLEETNSEGQPVTDTVRRFDAIIDLAQSTRENAVGDNVRYNKDREQEVRYQLQAQGTRGERLDDLVALQFRRLKQQFPDGIPKKYFPMLQKLQRQHENMRSQIIADNDRLEGELVTVTGRLTEASIAQEMAQFERELSQPYRTGWEQPAQAPNLSQENQMTESLSYLQQLADSRIRRKVMQTTQVRGMPVVRQLLHVMVIDGTD